MPALHPDLSAAAIQTLFISGRPWDGSASLRELKESSGQWEKVTVEQFILGLLEKSKTLAAAGLSLTFEGGQVDLTTCRIEEGKLNDWLASFGSAGSARFSESMLEALSIVALRQPVVAA